MQFKIKSLVAAISLLAFNSIQAADKREFMQIEPGVAMAAMVEAKSSGAHRFIGPGLLMMQAQARSALAAAASGSAKSQSKPGIPSSGLPQGLTVTGAVLQDGMVSIEALSKGDDAVLMRELAAAGAQDVQQSGNLVSARLSPLSVDALRAVSSAQFIRVTPGSIRLSGKSQSGGDKAQRSNLARNRFGVNGKGATVGIISDSWNVLGGAAAGIASGELPGPGNPNGFTTPVNVLKEQTNAGNLDEGRAMGEIVHDVAPGAKLAFYGPESLQDHAKGVRKLAAAGATVIVDDKQWFADPWYQPGPISLASRDVLAKNNTVVVSAAGNSSTESAEGVFNPLPVRDTLAGGVFFGKYELHDFGKGKATIPVTLSADANITFVMQWDEPFASASLNRQGSRSDLDLLFFTESQGVNLAFGAGDFNIGGDAFESITIRFNPVDPNETLTVHMAVGRVPDQGEKPRGFKLFVYDQGTFTEFDPNRRLFNKPTIVGHSASEWVISTCAVPYFGVNGGNLSPEGFSSVGGFKRTRDQFGDRLPIPRDTLKPDICSPDGVNTSFFDFFDFEGDGFPNFFGTSAAAPHTAGIAALMQEASGMKISAFAVGPLMRRAATDITDTRDYADGTIGIGYDRRSGYGFLYADKAVEAARFFKPAP
jgi:Subtilase family